MDEAKILNIIKNTLSDNSYIGDDCAILKDLGLCVTQDTLVEDIHFSLSFITPFQLGVKSVSVNISDLCASLALPKYITVSISLPKTISENFVEEFYKGINSACLKYQTKVIGGDITGSDKIMISICAIGLKDKEIDVSRSNAQINDVVVITGPSGMSSRGLQELLNNKNAKSIYTEAHLNPDIAYEQANILRKLQSKRICSMDTSDGLADAIFKITQASNVSMIIDATKIPNVQAPDLTLYGGEDYTLLLTMDRETYNKLDKTQFIEIGKVVEKSENIVSFGENTFAIDENSIKNCFNHFGGNK